MSWDDSVVQSQTNIILKNDQVSAWRKIEEHWLNALRAFKMIFERIKLMKQLYYDSDSYYNS